MILTGYEIANFDLPESSAALWAQVMKETSHILLVCYSAFNPLACCGELLFKSLIVPIFNLCGHCSLKKTYVESELIQMKSIGVTVNGSACIDQVFFKMQQIYSIFYHCIFFQLEEIDPQSKLLTGLKVSTRENENEKAKATEATV